MLHLVVDRFGVVVTVGGQFRRRHRLLLALLDVRFQRRLGCRRGKVLLLNDVHHARVREEVVRLLITVGVDVRSDACDGLGILDAIGDGALRKVEHVTEPLVVAPAQTDDRQFGAFRPMKVRIDQVAADEVERGVREAGGEVGEELVAADAGEELVVRREGRAPGLEGIRTVQRDVNLGEVADGDAVHGVGVHKEVRVELCGGHAEAV